MIGDEERERERVVGGKGEIEEMKESLRERGEIGKEGEGEIIDREGGK